MAPKASVLSLSPADAPSFPAHIAIIMDGNNRWAKEHGVSRLRGHTQGAEALRGLIESCKQHPYIQALTLYAFSMENWKRPADEVSDLMNLLRHYVKREAKPLHKAGVRLKFIGDLKSLSADIQKDLADAEALTANNTKLTVIMAISYGSRQEMQQAIQHIATKVKAGVLAPEAIDETVIAQHLYTHDTAEPDLLIRTGGTHRLSNFLLWQSAYTELFFSDVLWPDFTESHLKEAIDAYCQRERRFGARAV